MCCVKDLGVLFQVVHVARMKKKTTGSINLINLCSLMFYREISGRRRAKILGIDSAAQY